MRGGSARLAIPATFLLFAGVSLLSNGLIVKRTIHDIFVLFDSLWRSSQSEIPHLDFHSPIGQAYYWPFQLLGRFGDHDALTIVHANILVGAVMAVGLWFILPRRLSPGLLIVATVAILAMAMTPRDFDYWVTNYSYLAPYNRWSWAVLMLAAPIMLLPPSRERPWIDGVVLGLAIALLYYTKLNFLAAAIGMLVPALILRQMPWRQAAIALLTCALTALLVEAVWRNNAAYIADINMAARAALEEHNGLRIGKALRSLVPGGCFYALIVAMLWIRWPTLAIGRWLAIWWRPLLIGAGVVLLGVFVTVQDNPKYEFGHGVIALLIVAELARRRSDADLAGLPALRGGPLFGERARPWLGAIVIAGMLPFTAMDVVAIPAHAIESRSGRVCPLPALRGTQGARLLEPAEWIAQAPGASCSDIQAPPLPTPPATETNPFELQKIDQGMTLLRAHGRPGDIVLALDFSNPYPFFLAAPSPRRALIWWHYGRDYTAVARPDPAVMLASATLVLQTKAEDELSGGQGKAAWDSYGADVRARFRPVGETGMFRLWRRIR